MNGILKIIVVFILSLSLCSLLKAQELSVYVYTQNVNCFGQSDGSAEANVSGGVPPFQYLWSTGATSESISNLVAGLYSVTVQDASSTTVAEEFEISQPDLPLHGDITPTHVRCFGDGNGVADLDVFGGTPPYYFVWST
ncbi:MAG: SprB repeat-containing protein, partial [Bacteroidales bacterium]|nr:SprB repeat-containing protein [Bacteroidales bacterium]